MPNVIKNYGNLFTLIIVDHQEIKKHQHLTHTHTHRDLCGRV